MDISRFLDLWCFINVLLLIIIVPVKLSVRTVSATDVCVSGLLLSVDGLTDPTDHTSGRPPLQPPLCGHSIGGGECGRSALGPVYKLRDKVMESPMFVRVMSTICVVQYSTVQYSTVQYSTVQYSTVQYSTVQYSTVQYSTLTNSVIYVVAFGSCGVLVLHWPPDVSCCTTAIDNIMQK